MNTHPIQNYNLFGEAGDLPDVVHCETIEARSKLHDWEFSPHRHARLHQFLLIEAGRGTALIEATATPLAPGLFVNMPTGTVHGFSFRPGTVGWVVTIATEVLDEILPENEGLRAVLAKPYVGKSMSEMKGLMESIFAEFETRAFARAQILRALTSHFAGLAARRIFQTGPALITPDLPLQRRFETLLETGFLKQWSVADYAAALAVSPTHLSRVLRGATGMSTSRLIEARLIREARRMLAYTNLPVSQVAYALGYIDPAYFSRAFRRATGLPPRDFRARLDNLT